jgi:hypothetical protein
MKFSLPLEKNMEVGCYSVREKSILKVIDTTNWIYFDPTGEPPPPELYQLKYVPSSSKYVVDSELYLVAFDKYMDTLYKPTDEVDLSHKPLEKNVDDFIEMITKVNIEDYINSLNVTSSDNTETPTSNS